MFGIIITLDVVVAYALFGDVLCAGGTGFRQMCIGTWCWRSRCSANWAKKLTPFIHYCWSEANEKSGERRQRRRQKENNVNFFSFKLCAHSLNCLFPSCRSPKISRSIGFSSYVIHQSSDDLKTYQKCQVVVQRYSKKRNENRFAHLVKNHRFI